jgi:hypothetical protein
LWANILVLESSKGTVLGPKKGGCGVMSAREEDVTQSMHQEIPADCRSLFKSFYYLFMQRYENEAKTLDQIQEKVQAQKMSLDKEVYERLIKEIAFSRLRITYFSQKVLTENEFLSMTQPEEWRKLKTPFDYFQAILYLQNEFLKVHNIVSAHLSKKTL